MATPRKQLISFADTPDYHIVSRCVRRAWLCGKDPYTKKDYSYRRKWFIKRLRQLATVFSIEISAYAVMSNHTQPGRPPCPTHQSRKSKIVDTRRSDCTVAFTLSGQPSLPAV